MRVEIRAEVSGIGPLVSVLPSAMRRPVRRMSRRPTKEIDERDAARDQDAERPTDEELRDLGEELAAGASSTQRHTAFDGTPQTWAISSGVAWAEVTSAARTGAAIAERR